MPVLERKVYEKKSVCVGDADGAGPGAAGLWGCSGSFRQRAVARRDLRDRHLSLKEDIILSARYTHDLDVENHVKGDWGYLRIDFLF